MPLADITEKIISDSREQALELVSQAEKNAEKIKKESAEEVSTLKKNASIELEKILSENTARVIAHAKQEGKRLLDSTKRKLMDTVFDTAFKELANLPEKEYSSYVEKLAHELPKDFDGKIIVPSKRAQETTATLKKAGFTKNISPTGAFSGGFIATMDTLEYNATFEKLFADKRSSLETKVANILFEDTSN